MKKSIYIREAIDLTDYLIDLTKNRKIPLEYTDIVKNKNFGNVMIDDFGDYLPFVEWLGKIADKKYSKWAEEKAELTIKKFQMPNGLITTSFKSGKQFPRLNNLKIFNSDKMSDTILGYNLMYDLTKRELYQNSSERFFRGLSKYMTSKKGFVYYKLAIFLKFPFSSGKYCGLYIEELVKLYEQTKKRKYLVFAERLANAWLRLSFFKKNGLFPFKCTTSLVEPFANILFKKMTSFSFDTFMLSKSNTNLLFGLIRLQKSIKSKKIELALNDWVDSVKNKLLTPEHILKSIWREKGIYVVTYLGADHAAIDVLLEIFNLNTAKNKNAKDLAIKIVDGWLKLQSKRTGLVMETPYKYSTSKLSKMMTNYSMTKIGISRLDSQTDFAIVVLKTYEITGKKKYLDATTRIAKGILKFHKYKEAYVEFVDVKTGEKKGNIIETKFLFLLLKLLLLMHEVKTGKKIYKEKLIYDIIRDR